MYKFSYCNSVSSRPFECGRDAFNNLIDHPEYKRICDAIAAEPDHKKQGEIKRKLAGFIFHATFKGEKRLAKDAIPSGLVMLDVDGMAPIPNPVNSLITPSDSPVSRGRATPSEGEGSRNVNEGANHSLEGVDVNSVAMTPLDAWAMVKERIAELRIVLAHITPSRRGLRIVFACPEGMDIPEAQEWFAKKSGLPNIDTCVKDLARLSFVVPRDYFLHIDYEALFENENETTDAYENEKLQNENETAGAYENEKLQNKKQINDENRNDRSNNNDSSNGDSNGADSYLGIPYSKLIHDWLNYYLRQKAGYTSFDAPVEGDRNNTLYDLCRDLRNVTDFSFQKLHDIVPRWGLSDAEVSQTIKSALASDRRVPFVLNQVLKQSSTKGKASSEEKKQESIDAFNQRYLERLPTLPPAFREALKGRDKKYHMAILSSLFAASCSYADKVLYKYADGAIRRPNLQVFVVGKPASGKSNVTDVMKKFLKPMKEHDTAIRKKHDEIKESNELKADKDRGAVSHDWVKKLNFDTTDADLLSWQKLAHEHGNMVEGQMLPQKNFMFTEEASQIVKCMKSSKILEAWRCAFDNGEWGADRKRGISGIVDMSLDFVAECTMGVLHKLMGTDNIENGTASRLLITLMPDEPFAHMPMRNQGLNDDNPELMKGVELLRNAEGLIDAPTMRKDIREWCDSIADECNESGDEKYAQLRLRAGVMGMVCGIIWAILEDKKKDAKLVITKNARTAALVMAEYALESAYAVFADYDQNVGVKISLTGDRKGTKNKVLFDRLPMEFSKEDVRIAKGTSSTQTVCNLIRRYIKQGYIVETTKNNYKKISVKQ